MTLPQGWASATVGDVADLSDGPFGTNLKTAHYVESGPRVIRLQNIGEGVFRDERAHITPEHYARLAKHAVRAGDLVVASLGDDAPRACLVPEWLGPAVVKADCIRVRPCAGVDSSFLMWMLNSPSARRQAASLIKGVGRPRLGLRGIRSLLLAVPPLAEQRRIVAVIDEQYSKIDAIEAAIEALVGSFPPGRGKVGALRASILARAFNGELVPQDPNEEPATVLLERIAAERAAAPARPRRRGVPAGH